MFSNNIRSSALRASVRRQSVYVVTTPAPALIPAPARQLFGVHRRGKEDLYSSHVLGFTDEAHAVVVAKSLETYHRQHGRFPSRDLVANGLCMETVDSQIDLCHVGVERVCLADLLQRLRGTGIAVTLLTALHDPDATPASPRMSFKCRDVRPDHTVTAVVRHLNRTWEDQLACPAKATQLTVPVPDLLPRPVWPPATAERPAAKTSSEKQIIAGQPPQPSTSQPPKDVPLVIQMLAAALLKCCAIAEVMVLFWLLPEFF